MINKKGKEIRKYNAVKHGVLTRVLLDSEVTEAQQIYKEFVNDYKPETQTEYILIQDIATACIRKSRAVKAEREYFTQVLNPAVYEEKIITPPLIEDDNFLYNMENGEKKIILLKEGYISKISDENIDKIERTFVRYINSCEKQFYRALHELQRIQAIRKGLKPTSVAVDFINEERREE